MLEIKDLHEFFRSEYAPVHEKPEHRLLIQNFIEFCNSRNAAQQPLAPDAHGLAAENDEEPPEFGTGGWMSAR